MWGISVGFSTDDDISWRGLDGCSIVVQGRGRGVLGSVCVCVCGGGGGWVV